MSNAPITPDPGSKVKLADHDPEDTHGVGKEEALAEIDGLRTRLSELQNTLYGDKRYGMLVVLQAIDTGGKDGTIKSVFREVGPLGSSVANFGVPSAEEMAHDYLWRYHRQAPERGKMVIFNRSHYESVLVERVHELVPEKVWKARYGQINSFEEYLASQGTVTVKFFLHISKDEQRERLQDRIDRPDKRWKFRSGDLDDRNHWDEYQAAFEDMVTKCNTKVAPWNIVPADHKWYRDVVVARTLIQELEKLDLHYPEPVEGIKGMKVV